MPENERRDFLRNQVERLLKDYGHPEQVLEAYKHEIERCQRRIRAATGELEAAKRRQEWAIWEWRHAVDILEEIEQERLSADKGRGAPPGDAPREDGA